MINKLSSVQKRKQPSTNYIPPPYSSQTLTVNTESPPVTIELSEGISEQFEEGIKAVKRMIFQIKHNNNTITGIKKRYEQSIKSTQERKEVEKILDENSKNHKSIEKIMMSLKAQIDRCSNDPTQKNQPQTRMKKNMFITLSQQVMNVIQQQRSQSDSFKSTVKNRITRQAKFIDPTLSQQQLQQYADNPQKLNELLNKKVKIASFNLKYAVADIQQKFEQIQRLQKSVNECLYLFKQLSQMVFAQGQQIDNIEMNCREAQDYIEKGADQVQKAKKKQQCKKKCCCWSIIIGIIVGIIVITVAIPIALKAVKPF